MTESAKGGKPAEFDNYAQSYDAGMDNPVKALLGQSADDFIRVKVDWLGQRLPSIRDNARLRLLDYGCGAGALLRVLARQGWKPQLSGCDVSTGMLETARSQWPEELGPCPGLDAQDGSRTLYESKFFDTVVISAVLHHVPLDERDAVMAEIRRILKPGGHLVIFEHNPLNPVTRYVVARTPIDRNAILLDASEARERLKAAGFLGTDISYLMLTPPRFRWMRSLDRVLEKFPLGAQYAASAVRSA